MSRRLSVAGVGLAGLAIVAFLALMGWALVNRSPATGTSGMTRVGEEAPGFSMPLFDGGRFELREHQGEPLLVNFWASWCGPCRVEAPVLERGWQRYRARGVTVVGVNIQNTERDARGFIEEFDVTYPNGRDPEGTITIDYGVVGIPVTFFVDRDGTVAGRFVGALSDRQLSGWAEALLAGVERPEDLPSGNRDDFFELGGDR